MRIRLESSRGPSDRQDRRAWPLEGVAVWSTGESIARCDPRKSKPPDKLSSRRSDKLVGTYLSQIACSGAAELGSIRASFRPSGSRVWHPCSHLRLFGARVRSTTLRLRTTNGTHTAQPNVMYFPASFGQHLYDLASCCILGSSVTVIQNLPARRLVGDSVQLQR